ncbi:MAG: carbonic anhydrase [Clostridia bacterium]|nr:carbonic anhydrase [Clostridia bacterium]
MDFYKKIIRNQKLRLKILHLLRFIPDKPMLKIQYSIKTGKKLNLKEPKKFTEKIQWYKLNYKNPILPTCVDKYEVREYVKNKKLGNILNELYGVFDKPEDINIDKLPDKFVLKTTNGGGGLNVFICKDKSKFDFEKVKKELSKAQKNKLISSGREWPYKKIQPRIIAERFIEHSSNEESLTDYKFYCFNGLPQYLLLINGRESKKKKSIYDIDFNLLKYKYDDYDRINDVRKPDNYNEMVKIAAELSKDFPFVRVDLYNTNGKIIFGELTFYPASGYLEKISPDGFDLELGEKFYLKKYF